MTQGGDFMRIEMEFQGLDELVKALEECATDKEIQNLNKNIVTKAQPIIEREMSSRMPKSKNQELSGRGFGSKSHPSGHAADAVPIAKVKTSGTRAEADVGWTKSDNSEHFYVKFINWGTVDRPPQEFIYKAGRASEGQIQSIAEQEYQEFLDKTVG